MSFFGIAMKNNHDSIFPDPNPWCIVSKPKCLACHWNQLVMYVPGTYISKTQTGV